MIVLQQTTVGHLDELIRTTETLGNKIEHSQTISLYGQDFKHVRNARTKFKLLTRGTSGLIVNDRRAKVFRETALRHTTGSEDSINNIFLMLIGGHPLKKESIYETPGGKYCKPEIHKYFVDVLIEALTMHATALAMEGHTLSPRLSKHFNEDIVKATSAYNRYCDCAPGLKKANRGQVSTLLDRLPSASQNLFQIRGIVARMENRAMRIKMDLILAVKNFEPNKVAESILESHSVEDIELVVASVMNKKEDDLELHDSADICVDGELNKATCRGGATTLSTSPGHDMVLCKDKTQSTCEKDFETLCPAGWNLCTPGQFNNRNWQDPYVGYPLGAIYCWGGGYAWHYHISKSAVLNTDQQLNCGWDSSRPGCEGFAGACNDKGESALCCAPTRTCGDGLVQQEEDCDDGNNSCTWKKPGEHGLSGC